jgi:hypothetical protein
MLVRNGLAESIRLEEGSGISRGNRFTARGLAQLLHLFEPHANLLRSGDGALFKTGSISGVRTLAGYADTSKHGRVRFVIALTSNDGPMRFRLLKSELSRRRAAEWKIPAMDPASNPSWRVGKSHGAKTNGLNAGDACRRFLGSTLRACLRIPKSPRLPGERLPPG